MVVPWVTKYLLNNRKTSNIYMTQNSSEQDKSDEQSLSSEDDYSNENEVDAQNIKKHKSKDKNIKLRLVLLSSEIEDI